MFKKVAGALATLLAVTVFSAPAASASYSPGEGAIFNDPTGVFTGKLALMNRVEATIDSTPLGATILISTYLLDRKVTVDKLIKAARSSAAGGRANSVQVVMDKGIDNFQSRRLMRVLNADNDTPIDPVTGEVTRGGPDRSFAYKCIGSCRGAGGNDHAKFYAFSQAGTSSNVVMVSSANLNKGGAYAGYNDLFTMVNKEIYDKYAVIHSEMRDDTDRDLDAYQTLTSGRFENRFFPMRHATKATDPVMVDLSRVRCFGSTGDAGRDGRTVIHISMFSWGGTRGMYITDRLLQLQRAGCIVSVMYGAPSNDVAAVLRHAAWQGRINLYDTRVHRNDDGQVDLRVHSKYLLISGNFGGNTSAWQVYTGSQNWTDGALTRADEIMLGIKGRPAYSNYLANWIDVRRTGSRTIGG